MCVLFSLEPSWGDVSKIVNPPLTSGKNIVFLPENHQMKMLFLPFHAPKNDDRCFCGVLVWCFHMNNIAKIRRHRDNPIGRDKSTCRLKPMCVVTFRIPFF